MPFEYKMTAGFPDAEFWGKFAILWKNSLDRSPFEAPYILQYFARETNEKVVTFEYYADHDLRGAIILKQRHGNLTFLSDMKTDVNFFVLHQEGTPQEWKAFFSYILESVNKENWSLTLNNQPSWAPYMPIFEETMRESGMFWHNMPYSVCPVVNAESPKALYDHIHGLRELRYRVNRLKSHEQAVFEVFTDDDGLDGWVEEFCEAHVLRWADTPTPSHLKPAAARQFLKDCLAAWNTDGLLVRFSIRVSLGRIGFVIALRESQSLIHHSTTFHPDFKKSSPGKALIHFMGEWMLENDIQMLDFGDGNEPYKYTVANKEHQLNRIFVSNKYNLPFVGKTHLINFVRNHPKAYAIYQNRLKPLLGAS